MSSTTRSGPGAVTGGISADLAQRNYEPNARAKSADTISDLGSAAKQAADTLVSATTEKLKDAANQSNMRYDAHKMRIHDMRPISSDMSERPSGPPESIWRAMHRNWQGWCSTPRKQ